MKKNVQLTLNRKGRCKANHSSANQCKAVGHKLYDYEARITVGPKLDKQGFVIDHLVIHNAVKDVFENSMTSCECLALNIADAIEKACKKHKCKVISIYVRINPVPKSKKDAVMAFMETEIKYS